MNWSGRLNGASGSDRAELRRFEAGAERLVDDEARVGVAAEVDLDIAALVVCHVSAAGPALERWVARRCGLQGLPDPCRGSGSLGKVGSPRTTRSGARPGA